MSKLGLLNAILLVMPLFIAVYLSVHAWRRRKIPGAMSFMYTMAVVGSWCGTAALVITSRDYGQARFWLGVMMAVVPYLPVCILAAAAQTTGHSNVVQRKYLFFWLVIPSITAILSLLGESQQIYAYQVEFIKSGQDNIGWVNKFGFWTPIHLAYSYALVSLSVLMLTQQFARLRFRIYRMRILLLLLGLMLPFLANVMNTLFIDIHTFINPMVFNISAPMLFWALFRYRLFDLLPVARDQAFEHMQDAIFIVDEETRVVDINPKAALLTQQNPLQLLDRPMFESFPHFEAGLKPVLAKMGNHEQILVQEGDKQRYFEVTISPIRRDGEQVGKLIIVHDKTEQYVAEQRAHRLEVEHERLNTLSAFIEAASHEFRTPLSVIKNATFIANRLDDDTKRVEKLEQIDDQVMRISRLVDALLSIVRLDASTQLDLAPLDVNTVVQMVWEKIKMEAAAQQVKVELTLAPDLPQIQGNTFHLTEAIFATIHNAVRYTPANGQVKLTTEHQNSDVIITIEDTGMGIDAEHLPHIFDAFYRVDKARTTAGFGTGLAIANRIINLHNGTIEASSMVGKGTTIQMKFPVAG